MQSVCTSVVRKFQVYLKKMKVHDRGAFEAHHHLEFVLTKLFKNANKIAINYYQDRGVSPKIFAAKQCTNEVDEMILRKKIVKEMVI